MEVPDRKPTAAKNDSAHAIKQAPFFQESASLASELCAACGLCCNGVLFHSVRLQPGDSPKQLSALGLKLKRKKRQDFILQPCPAYCESYCSIYGSRPGRCRLFECRQLKQVAAGVISPAEALEKIREAKRRVAEVDGLLLQIGGTNPKKPLSKRCEKALAEPADPSSESHRANLHNLLTCAMRELDDLLDRDFRIEKN